MELVRALFVSISIALGTLWGSLGFQHSAAPIQPYQPTQTSQLQPSNTTSATSAHAQPIEPITATKPAPRSNDPRAIAEAYIINRLGNDYFHRNVVFVTNSTRSIEGRTYSEVTYRDNKMTALQDAGAPPLLYSIFVSSAGAVQPDWSDVPDCTSDPHACDLRITKADALSLLGGMGSDVRRFTTTIRPSLLLKQDNCIRGTLTNRDGFSWSWGIDEIVQVNVHTGAINDCEFPPGDH